MKTGYVYCFSNPSMPGMVKIGITDRTPPERAKELYTTGVASPFKIEFAKKVSSPSAKEKTLHLLLEQFTTRINCRREFFSVSPQQARMFFDLMDEEMWNEPDDIVEPVILAEKSPERSTQVKCCHADVSSSDEDLSNSANRLIDIQQKFLDLPPELPEQLSEEQILTEFSGWINQKHSQYTQRFLNTNFLQYCSHMNKTYKDFQWHWNKSSSSKMSKSESMGGSMPIRMTALDKDAPSQLYLGLFIKYQIPIYQFHICPHQIELESRNSDTEVSDNRKKYKRSSKF